MVVWCGLIGRYNWIKGLREMFQIMIRLVSE